MTPSLNARTAVVAALLTVALVSSLAPPILAQDGAGAGDGAASVDIVAPGDGASLPLAAGNASPDVPVRVNVTGAALTPPGEAGDAAGGDGAGGDDGPEAHLHISLVPEETYRAFNETADEGTPGADVAGLNGEGEGAALGREEVSEREVVPVNGTVAAEDVLVVGRWIATGNATVTILDVPPQEYVLRAQLAGPDHQALDPPAFDQINFTVGPEAEAGLEPGEAPPVPTGGEEEPSPAEPAQPAPVAPALVAVAVAVVAGGVVLFLARQRR